MFKAPLLLTLAAVAGISAAQAARFDQEIPVRIAPTSTFYVGGYMEGFGETDFMIDTGSSYTTINEVSLEALQAQGKAIYVRDLTGSLADGSKITVPIYRITSLSIGGECQLNNVEAAVFPGKTRHILGLSALNRAAPFAFSVEPPSLLLSHCDVDLQRTAREEGNR